MTSLVMLILAIVWIVLVYRFYGRYVDRKIVQSDPKKATPAVMYMDGVEFMPANRNVLFGFQFKSICGLGPIVGAIMAVNWGWVPAMLYLMLGVAFIGWIHDYSATMVGLRREGMSLGGMSYTLISPRARTLISIFIYFNLMLSFGAFALLIAGNLSRPHGPLGVIIYVFMGLLAGQMIYKWKQPIITTTVVTVVITFFGIFYLTSLAPVMDFFKTISGGDKPPIIFGTVDQAKFIWVIAVLVFCYFGAVLPIWRWAQPINYLGFWVVFIGMIMIGLGILFWNPSFGNFPAFRGWWWGANPLWPMLFVTIMCGAVSGWHSLVGSSGTARMLEKETDTLPVAGGSMLLEMIMGMLALIIAVSAFGSFEGYADAFKRGAGAVFMVGGANFLGKIGIPAQQAAVFANIMFAVIGLTLIHLGVRFMRLYGADVLGEFWPIFKNVQFSTIFTLILFGVFCFTGILATLWFLGGSFNQMLASMALLIASCWLAYERKNYKITLIPSIFLLVTTVSAAIWISYGTIKHFFITPDITIDRAIGNWLTGLIALFLVFCALVLVKDAFAAIRKFTSEKREEGVPAPAPGGSAK
ncbi:MAG: carbon starvation CstA family protein [Thermodesulfobacteriota bacterium]|nr:carbon starvation CstA family protein [Thermodesulfobacteriota bacterium]